MKQRLSAQARRDKAARDLAFAKSPARRAKKAHAQRESRANPSAAAGKDFDHKRGRFVSVKSNRGNEAKELKKRVKAVISTNTINKVDNEATFLIVLINLVLISLTVVAYTLKKYLYKKK